MRFSQVGWKWPERLLVPGRRPRQGGKKLLICFSQRFVCGKARLSFREPVHHFLGRVRQRSALQQRRLEISGSEGGAHPPENGFNAVACAIGRFIWTTDLARDSTSPMKLLDFSL